MLKDPDATLDYGFDWTRWLAADTIISSTWTVPSGLTKVSDTHDATSTTVWLSGGTVGTEYALVNRITTAAGRIDDRTLHINVRENA